MNESFLRWLRHALNHLYNPDELRASPLYQLLGLDPGESSSTLRRILVTAIEALRPQADLPPDSDAWRAYKVLYHRYVQQFSQEGVATSLGLSVRQMQRQTTLALQMLADYLWDRYDLHLESLPSGPVPVPQEPASEAADSGVAADASEGTPLVQELGWLERSSLTEPVDVSEVIQGAMQTIGPLAEAAGVRLEAVWGAELPRVVARREVLRQVLLNVLVAAIHSVPGGLVRIEAGTHVQGMRVSMRPLGPSAAPTAEPTDERDPNLKMARDLLELSGGSMSLTSGENPDYSFSISLTLPAVSQVPVLVVDDNLDALQLFRRYLAGTYYSFIPAREPEQAVALAEALSPGIIVLDVMLPGVDGWELLGRLREHPRIRGTPIIVCTILPQEQLAMALGAADFLRKPVGRATLLAALDRQTEALAREQRC